MNHSFTCKLHHVCLFFVSVHQMVPPLTEVADIQLHLTAHLSTPERMKGWVGLVGWPLADGHPSDTGLAQNRESSPAKDRRSTAVPYNQSKLRVHTTREYTGSVHRPLILDNLYLFYLPFIWRLYLPYIVVFRWWLWWLVKYCRICTSGKKYHKQNVCTIFHYV